MLQSRKIKYRKVQKGSLKNSCTRGYILTKGDYGLKALDYARLDTKQLEATIKVLVKTLKKSGNIYTNVCADLPISKKPSGVRMGGGKGETNKWVCKIKPGKILFEINNVSKETAQIVLKNASAKLPIKTKIVELKKYYL